MDYLYAQLDENNICTGLSQLSGEVIKDNMIRLTEDEFLNDNLLGKWYNNGVWSDVNAETLQSKTRFI